jgi:protein SCO1/2
MKTYARRTLGLILAGLILTGATGCDRTEKSGAAASAPAVAARADGAERYALTGEVLSVNEAGKAITVRHDEVKGLMPAMTMDFAVSGGDVRVLKAGQHIRAELVREKNGDSRLEKIWPDDQATNAAIAAGARGLREDTMTKGKAAYRDVGEAIPNFTLLDQEGRVITSGRFRGKTVMLNFIFTRCPFVDKCPAATLKMMAAQKQVKAAALPNIELISITLDPAYDTPGILKEYAAVRGIDPANFSFLTGPEGAIRDLLTQFGVVAEFEGDLLKHSLATLLIDPTGKIIHRADGSGWEPEEFVAKMKK